MVTAFAVGTLIALGLARVAARVPPGPAGRPMIYLGAGLALVLGVPLGYWIAEALR